MILTNDEAGGWPCMDFRPVLADKKFRGCIITDGCKGKSESSEDVVGFDDELH